MTYCSICNPPQRYYHSSDFTELCASCNQSGKGLMEFINKLENDNAMHNDVQNNSSDASPPNSSKGLSDALKLVKEAVEKSIFMEGFAAAFKKQFHTDIEVKPGHSGPSVRAHRALLASRSVIFKTMLDSDICKAAPGDSVTLPELTHEELHALLEFLYTGSLPADKVQKHAYSLLVAADKYEIPYLQKFCEQRMLASLSPSTALDVLEISDACSNSTLKEASLNFIVTHMEDIVFTPMYETFAIKNPRLCVQITRASVRNAQE